MFSKWFVLLTVSIFSLAALASCGGSAASLAPQDTPSASDSTFPVLPADKGAPVHGASDIAEINGSDFFDSFGATVDGMHAILASTATDPAWALYQVQGLAGKDVSSLSIEFELLAPDTQYSVGVSNYSDGAWLFLSTSSDPEFHFDLTDELARLINEEGNLYFVVVVNGGASITVDSASVESHQDDDPMDDLPGMAGGLIVSEGLPDRIELSWDAAAGATGYEDWRKLDSESEGQDGSEPQWELIATVDGTAYTDSAVQLSVEYDYRIRALSDAGPAGFSEDQGGYAGAPPAGEDVSGGDNGGSGGNDDTTGGGNDDGTGGNDDGSGGNDDGSGDDSGGTGGNGPA